VDSGVPQASNRASSHAGGGGVAKPPAAKGAAGKHGNGTARPGPVDPRTEDSSAPLGVSRGAKTVWRRPGSLTQRTAKRLDPGLTDAPIDFSVATPLAPEPTEVPAATATEPMSSVAVDADSWAESWAVASTIEVLAPAPTELVPTTLVPEADPDPVTETSPILYDDAATIDDVTKIGPVLETRPLLRPVNFRRAPKPRVRRVTRVVRHVDTWSVFKVALVFNVFFYVVALVAGVLLWQVAYATGTIDNVEKFFEGFGWETFNFNGGQIFHNAWIAGLFVAVGMTGLAVLIATLFNLITDLVGGIRLSVLEEEVLTRVARGTEQVTPEPVAVPVQLSLDMDDFEFETQMTDPPDEAIAG
jgi:Transmembrane domain of unknown function (DUF3566)